MAKKYLNVMEAKEYLRLSRTTIYTYIYNKRIPYIKVGERLVFDQADLEKWMEKKKKCNNLIK